jgi:hypothetical protein
MIFQNQLVIIYIELVEQEEQENQDSFLLFTITKI